MENLLRLRMVALSLMGTIAVPAVENLVRNGDFTEGLKHWETTSESAPGPRFSLDGGHLMWQSQRKSGYVIAWQKIQGMKPGRYYLLSGNVKCDRLTGAKESGATLCLEFHGEQFREGFRYNAHPGGVRNTQDWTRITSVIGPVPAEAAGASVGLYVRRNSVRNQFFTGFAWWKNIELKQIPMLCQILDPSYKMNISDKLTLKFRLWPEDWQPASKNWRIRVSIFPKKDGEVVPRTVFSSTVDPVQEEFVWSRSVHVSPGTYQLTVELLDQAGNVGWRDDHEIHRKDSSKARVKIDDKNRILVDQKPYFVYGIYHNAYTRGEFDGAFDFISRSGLNTLVSYKEMTYEQLDRYWQSGRRVILSVKDYFHAIWYCPGSISSPGNEIFPLARFVRKYMNHPALLAWYVNDELGLDVLESHESHYEVINRLDHHHPAWNLHNTIGHLPLLSNHCDLMGIDEYPLVRPGSRYLDFRKKMRAIYDTMETGVRMLENRKPLIAVLQCYDVYEQQPTVNDIRSMSYQALAAGACGIVYYALENDFRRRNPRHWQEFSDFTHEFIARKDVFLSREPVIPVQVEGKEVACFQRRFQNRNHVFLVSLAERNTTVQVRLTAGVSRLEIERNGRRSFKNVDSGRYSSVLCPYEVQILMF